MSSNLCGFAALRANTERSDGLERSDSSKAKRQIQSESTDNRLQLQSFTIRTLCGFAALRDTPGAKRRAGAK
jgi:hypothetical protein